MLTVLNHCWQAHWWAGEGNHTAWLGWDVLTKDCESRAWVWHSWGTPGNLGHPVTTCWKQSLKWDRKSKMGFSSSPPPELKLEVKQERGINYKGNCRATHPQKFLFSVCFRVRIVLSAWCTGSLCPKVKKSQPDTEPGESLVQRFCRPFNLLFTAKCVRKSYLKELISLQHVFAFMSSYFKHTPLHGLI